MTPRLMTILAFAVFAGFLLILLGKVLLPDLGAVILVTIGFAAYDLFLHDRRRKRS